MTLQQESRRAPMGSLHHLEINVDNLEKTRVFWSWFFHKIEWDLFQSWEHGFSYKNPKDGSYIVFVQTENKYRFPLFHRKHSGLNHLAFQVKSQVFIDNLKKELIERHVDLLYEDRYPFAGGPNHYALFFEDINRIKVEVVLDSSAK